MWKCLSHPSHPQVRNPKQKYYVLFPSLFLSGLAAEHRRRIEHALREITSCFLSGRAAANTTHV